MANDKKTGKQGIKESLSDVEIAMDILRRNGYRIYKEIRIGDIVMIDGRKALITFRQTDRASYEDVFEYGGVYVHEETYKDSYWEPVWVDSLEYMKDPSLYPIVGHIDLSEVITTNEE